MLLFSGIACQILVCGLPRCWPFSYSIDVVCVGAKANKGAVVEDGKLQIKVEAHQTVSHLKALIATAIKGVELPFELQQHGAKESDAYDDNDALSDAGLVSGSVVSVPAELVDIHFVLPRGVSRELSACKIYLTYAYACNCFVNWQ